MIRKLFYSQLRINMVSGFLTTCVNVIVLVIAYPLYLHFLGYEKYGVWFVFATVLSFAQLGNIGSKAKTPFEEVLQKTFEWYSLNRKGGRTPNDNLLKASY